MSLFSQLHMGLGALRAHQYGLEVTGDNIANVSTPGFSRRRLTLSHARALDRYPVGQLGGGVESGPVNAVRDRFLESRHRLESSIASGDEARHRLLEGVEAVFSEESGFGFQEELSAFFHAFSDVGSEPESAVFREQAIVRADQLIDRLQGAHERLGRLAREVDQDVTRVTSQVNGLLGRIATLNESIARTEATIPANAERDERGQALLELSNLVEVASYENGDATVTVTLADGSPLVVGSEVETLDAVPQPPSGRVALFRNGQNVTSMIGSGELGGLLAVRDQTLPGHRRTLDELAFEVMDRVNTVHQSGYALDGATTGIDFFTAFVPVAPGDPTGATMAMAVDPAVRADSNLIAAAASPSAAGNGDQAQAVADLSDVLTMSAGTATFTEYTASFVFGLGAEVQQARTAADASAAVADHVERQKLEVSAVSLDEEAVALVQFQRGYEAAARFIRVVDEITELTMTIGA